MKKIIAIVLLVAVMFVGCDLGTSNDTPETPNNPETPTNPTNPADPETPANPANPTNPADPAFWFKEIYEDLLTRTIDEDKLIDMGQIANTQYVFDAINAKWNTTFTPVSETATQAANCEYLLKMIDKANGNRTSF
jgi:PBP1b-binding outer membrane lipoprotein LpoB